MGVTSRRFAVSVAGDEVVGVLHLPASTPSPCVVACHGMGASKDSEKYLLLGREFPAAGLALARFDFRGSGESGGRYAEATIATRIADLEAVLDHLAKQPELEGRFGLLGSSLGGFVALWVAASRPGLAVVTWNAPADLRDLRAPDPDDPGGPGAALVAEVPAGRHAEAPGTSHILIIQAERDDVVPPAHGRLLYERCRPPRELAVLAGADHRLLEPAHRLDALEKSRRWFLRHLSPEP
ncbi:MAG TPA: alpha/beta fold hydrolase [Methylomirabilota bacterium]|nr:alpha/beta fold hydrolase [Methylomirabilota bacterium]